MFIHDPWFKRNVILKIRRYLQVSNAIEAFAFIDKIMIIAPRFDFNVKMFVC